VTGVEIVVCVARCAEKFGRTITGLADSARMALVAYSWPGNVRELSHMIERAVLLTRSEQIEEVDLQIPGTKQRYARGSQDMPKVAPRASSTATSSSPFSRRSRRSAPSELRGPGVR